MLSRIVGNFLARDDARMSSSTGEKFAPSLRSAYRPGTDVQPDLAGVHLGKEIGPDERIQSRAEPHRESDKARPPPAAVREYVEAGCRSSQSRNRSKPLSNAR